VEGDAVVLGMSVIWWEKYDRAVVGLTAFQADRESEERARRSCEGEGCWRKLMDRGELVLWGVGGGLEVRPWNP
jgi:hypothetical protein